MDLFATRRAQLQTLIADAGGVAPVADRIGKDRTQVSQWNTGHRSISETSARHIERCLRKPPGWLDGAAGLLAPALTVQDGTSDTPYNWPFRTDYKTLVKLGAKERRQIDDFMEYVVKRWEETHVPAGGARAA
jgi:hypothetical protein